MRGHPFHPGHAKTTCRGPRFWRNGRVEFSCLVYTISKNALRASYPATRRLPQTGAAVALGWNVCLTGGKGDTCRGTVPPRGFVRRPRSEDVLGSHQCFPQSETRQLEGMGHLFQGAYEGNGVHVVEKSQVSDAEDLPLHLRLSVGDDGSEAALQLVDDDAGIEASRGQCGRHRGSRSIRGEELQAQGLHRGAGHGGAGFSVFHQLGTARRQIAVRLTSDIVEGRSQPRNQGHRRSVGGFPLSGVLSLFAQIEVVAGIERDLHQVPGTIADCQVGKAGRNHDRFLRSADKHIDAPRIHIDVRGAEASDGVHHQHRVLAALLQYVRDARNIVAHAGRGLGSLHEDGTGFYLERLAHLFQVEGLAIRRADYIDIASESLCQADPALAELARRQHQHAVSRRGQVRNRRFHRSGTGGGEQYDVILGPDKCLQVAEHLQVQGAKFGSPVVYIGCSHSELSRRQKRGGTRSKKTGLTDHGSIVINKAFYNGPLNGNGGV